MTRSDPDEGAWRSEQIETAVREIERYLLAHPNASDTLQGVQDWWLAGLATTPSLEVVQAALDRLVDAGVVAGRPVPGGIVYRRVRQEDRV
ncbi:MAG: hypothetical protein HYY76_05145 [Acidobacteria bacterium]|nr:hypothetical protein [Acidobacteriota bacterium]